MKILWAYLRGGGRLIALIAAIAWAILEYALFPRHRRDLAARARWLQCACRRVLRVIAVTVECTGEPPRGAVVVSNHLGYLDVVVLASLTPTVFVAKKEVRQWPVFGGLAARAGTLFIDRSRRADVARVGQEFEPVVTAGLSLVLFLEGTSSDGRTVLPFRSSLLEPVVRHGWRVVPTGLSYVVPTGHSVEREVCWWGEMTLVPHLLNLLTVPWVRVQIGRGEHVRGSDRRDLAMHLQHQVEELRSRASVRAL